MARKGLGLGCPGPDASHGAVAAQDPFRSAPWRAPRIVVPDRAPRSQTKAAAGQALNRVAAAAAKDHHLEPEQKTVGEGLGPLRLS
eukprot:7778916-Alexandrium_andersonii.AAC.1